jgi:hypothetical protein
MVKKPVFSGLSSTTTSRTTTSACKTAPTRRRRGRQRCGKRAFFGSHSQIRTIVLPRQARDKHKETLIKEAFFPQGDYSCTDLVHNRACWGGNMCNTNCYPTESIANNFIVLRSMTGSRFGNTLYAEFATGNQMQTASKNRSF